MVARVEVELDFASWGDGKGVWIKCETMLSYINSVDSIRSRRRG
jgi:hypothetical protein